MLSIRQALVDGFSEVDPAAKIHLGNNAELFYVWEVMNGNQKRVFNFTIVLEEEIDHTKKLERQLQRVSDRVTAQEVKILELGKENSKLKSEGFIERIDRMERLINPEVKELDENSAKEFEQSLLKKFEIVENKIPEIKESVEKTLVDFETKVNLLLELNLGEKPKSLQLESSCVEPFAFDPSCTHAGLFFFYNANKTITSRSSGWISAIGNQKISKNQKTKFSVRLDQTSSRYIVVGICPSNLKTNKTIYTQAGVCCYYSCNYGHIHHNDKSTELFHPRAEIGSVITVTVNLAKSYIAYKLNGIPIYKFRISYSPYKKESEGSALMLIF